MMSFYTLELSSLRLIRIPLTPAQAGSRFLSNHWAPRLRGDESTSMTGSASANLARVACDPARRTGSA